MCLSALGSAAWPHCSWCVCREEGSSPTLNEAFEDFEAVGPGAGTFNMGISPAAEQDASAGAPEAGEADETYADGEADE